MANMHTNIGMNTTMDPGYGLHTYGSRGWIPEKKITDVHNVRVQFDMNSTVSASAIDYEGIIRENLANLLAREILEKGLITILTEKREPISNPYGDITTYTASVNIAPDGMSHIEIDKYVYKVDGIEFPHEVIEKVMKDAYPEYYL